MTDREQASIEEVSARYGLPVMAGAFKQCPTATYTWQITGEQEDHSVRSRNEMWHRQRRHAQRLRAAISKEAVQ